VSSSHAKKVAQGVNGLIWVLATTACLILMVCLVSFTPHIIIFSENGRGPQFSSLPRILWHSFLRIGQEKPSRMDSAAITIEKVPSHFRR
jgi:hypothetical protein